MKWNDVMGKRAVGVVAITPESVVREKALERQAEEDWYALLDRQAMERQALQDELDRTRPARVEAEIQALKAGYWAELKNFFLLHPAAAVRPIQLKLAALRQRPRVRRRVYSSAGKRF